MSFFLDVNIEHIEFMLFVFHQLPLEKRKTILFQVAQTLVEISQLIDNM